METVQTELKYIKPGHCYRTRDDIFMRLKLSRGATTKGRIGVTNLRSGRLLVCDANESVTATDTEMVSTVAKAIATLALQCEEITPSESPEPWAVSATRITSSECTFTPTPTNEFMVAIGIVATTFVVLTGLAIVVVMLGLGLKALIENIL